MKKKDEDVARFKKKIKQHTDNKNAVLFERNKLIEERNKLSAQLKEAQTELTRLEQKNRDKKGTIEISGMMSFRRNPPPKDEQKNSGLTSSAAIVREPKDKDEKKAKPPSGPSLSSIHSVQACPSATGKAIGREPNLSEPMSTTGHLLQIMMPGALSHKRYSSFRPGEETDARMQAEIRKTIPHALDLGIAIGKGDCFFDAIAQQLSLARSEKYDVKGLRLLCRDYALSEKNDWVKTALLKDERSQAGYENYLARVSFTCEEMEKFDREGALKGEATWGRPDIEGVIFCKELGIRIHIIEVDPTIDPPVRHQLIDNEKSRSVDEASINYHDANTVHIIAYRNHFIPILPKAVLSAPAEGSKEKAHIDAPERTAIVSSLGQSSQKAEAEKDNEMVKKQKYDDKKIENTPGGGPSFGKR